MKSASLRMINRMVDPTSGTIRLGATLTTEHLTEPNRLVDKDPEDVANDWASRHGITKKQ
ncbi:hypothetical protein GCM10010349_32770 [Streptomyces flavofungini]|nr:hypothetical protein GCM10010349_32770 [Streptomyces flavofungini]